MIGLTNKTPDEINNLILKYQNVLELVKHKERVPTLAFIIDTAINHVKQKYNQYPINIKTWCVVLLEIIYTKINRESDIIKIIDEFMIYYNDEYAKYTSEIIMSTSDYDLEATFVQTFIDKKII